MKLVLTIILTLGAAVGFALLALDDPGYVVLARAPYTVRLPLALFALAATAAFAVLYLLFNFIAGVLRAPKRMRAWAKRAKQASAQRHTMRGYAGLIEGDWRSAERQLLVHLPHNQMPLLNYLGAAYAAQQQGNARRRDQYLADALARHPKQRLAIGLTAARLHYQSGEIAAARAQLEQLRKVAPNNAPAARLLADVYRDLKDWHSLTALLPSLTRLKALPPEELAARTKQAYAGRLSSPTMSLDGDDESTPSTQATLSTQATRSFKSLPAAQRRNASAVAAYARRLIEADDHVLAEKTLRRALNRGWDADLAYLYGRAETAFTDDQIKLAESWTRKYGERADLLLALARLHRRDRQYRRAKELFQRAIAVGGREEARVDLGALLEEMGEHDAALRCYRQGLAAAALAASDAAPADAPPLGGELVAPESDAESDSASETDDESRVMPMVR
ncbi:MAG: heme biosynthesis protein HemY [bacterium]